MNDLKITKVQNSGKQLSSGSKLAKILNERYVSGGYGVIKCTYTDLAFFDGLILAGVNGAKSMRDDLTKDTLLISELGPEAG